MMGSEYRPSRGWARSLYWRIGLGFFVLLALMLGVQAALFLWLAVETEGGVPERMGRDFAELVATDFESALARDPSLDLAQYAGTRLAEFHRPAFLALPDGRVIAPPGVGVPEGLTMPRRRGGPDRPPPESSARPTPDSRLPTPESRLPAPGAWPGPAREGGGMMRIPGGPPPMFGRRRMAAAPVMAQGRTAGMVFVAPTVGWRRVLEVLGPWVAMGIGVLLVGGTSLAAALVFRPAHVQLSALEHAARRFGAGDLSARAPVGGGDEVAAVAEAFNRMADDLAARQAELVDADRARRQLLADVSHELMTPLTAIRGYADTLTLRPFGPPGADGQRYVRIIQQEVERIERLVGDLLDLARYDAGGVSFVRETVAIADLFDRVVARHEQAAREKQVRIEVRMADEEMVVGGDARRLEQALQNLASNALRYTPAHGAITLSADRAGDRVRLRVADTGPGIAPPHLPYIFDRFYKADPARAETGSGLGLSIVKAIVERHGGAVTAASEPGRTTFEIDLPVSTA
jgi:signal transduction histidine kinase